MREVITTDSKMPTNRMDARPVRVTITVDAETHAALGRYPRGVRAEVIRAALRHYLLPGGQAEVLEAVEQVRMFMMSQAVGGASAPTEGAVEAKNVAEGLRKAFDF